MSLKSRCWPGWAPVWRLWGNIIFYVHSHCWQNPVPCSLRLMSPFHCWLSAPRCSSQVTFHMASTDRLQHGCLPFSRPAATCLFPLLPPAREHSVLEDSCEPLSSFTSSPFLQFNCTIWHNLIARVKSIFFTVPEIKAGMPGAIIDFSLSMVSHHLKLFQYFFKFIYLF